MLALCLLSLLALSQGFEPTLDNFHLWTHRHSKTYESEGERLLRALVWLDNAHFVKEKNTEQNGVTYRLNQFADLTHEEYKEKLSPVSQEDVERVKAHQILLEMPPWISLPASANWTAKGAVTPVKNQGQCGSCYSFSTTGAVEGACAIKTGKLVSLSEQQIMDCSWEYGNNGCNGGMFDRAFEYINQTGGIDTEKSYPYTGKESHTCKYNAKNSGGTVSAYYYVNQGNEQALAYVLANKGPVAVAINAGMRDFQFYSTGVYDNPKCDDSLNHGVLAVGYGVETSSGKAYFLVKNSWGPTWGLNGYVKMRRNKNNQCGIATYPSIPDC